MAKKYTVKLVPLLHQFKDSSCFEFFLWPNKIHFKVVSSSDLSDNIQFQIILMVVKTF